MILDFADKATEHIFHGENTKDARIIPKDLWEKAAKKLDLLNGIHDLKDLRDPPGNRLEGLKGRLKGFHSIRINDQYRIIFKWTGNSAEKVQITDYH